MEYLAKTPIGAVTKFGQLRVVNVTDTIEQGNQILGKYNILSAPVYTETPDKLVATLDIFDIATFMAFRPLFNGEDKEERMKEFYEFKSEKYSDSTVGELLCGRRATCRTRLQTYDESSSIKTMLPVLCNELYRTMVVSSDGNKKAMVSQMDLAQFLYDNKTQFGMFMNKSVGEIGMVGSAEVQFVQVPMREQVVEALGRMYINSVNTIAVVSDGDIVANFSNSDLRSITKDTFQDLLLPLSEFLQKRTSPRPPVTCIAQDSLGDVLRQALAESVQSIWVLKDTKPIGVITLSDILKGFLLFC